MKIFVANSGRCGSLFMSEVFRKLTTFPSFHEPMPRGDGKMLEYVNNPTGLFPNRIIDELYDKISQIKNDSRNGNYFESNQMFIKSFKDAVFRTLDDVYVIYLYRNPIEVTMSYYKKKQSQEKQWNNWHLQSHWKNNILRTSEPLSFYENCYWECMEIRERFLKLKYNDMPWHSNKTFEFDFRKLNDIREWKKLFRQFGIKHKPFDRLPIVSKNEIPGDRLKTLNGLLSKWDEPGVWDDEKQENYDKLDSLIDEGQKIMAHNERRLNAYGLS